MAEARLCFVDGCVQGVGFRYFTQQQAVKLGLSGYAKNLADGRVEVLIEGDLESLTLMLQWLTHGPPTATVDSLQHQQQAFSGVDGLK